MSTWEAIVRCAEHALDACGVAVGADVLVACSGGPDSAVLAEVAGALSASERLGRVVLMHVDHQLRDDGAADAVIVEALAQRSGAVFVSAAVEVDRARASLEDAAREARYAALDEEAVRQCADCVLLAHTATDQAETVLMRMARGTGVIGLAGMAVRRGHYVRPLLGVTRDEIEEVVAERRLRVADDPMNDDPRFTRNRIRAELLPILRRENPLIERALCRLAVAAREHRNLADSAAEQVLDRSEQVGDEWRLEVADLVELAPVVAKRVFALAADHLGAGPLEAVHLEAVLGLVNAPESGTRSLDLPRLQAVREYGRLRLVSGVRAAEERRIEVDGPNGPYEIRTWRPGDRMRPARLKGRSRKLSDLFTDAKVPRERRRVAIVVVRARDGAIAWAEHIGAAHDAAVSVTLTETTSVASNKD